MSVSLQDRPVCRRCKKKRPVDEPLETARYRTCEPCREIERKKKRLKKLEQTGIEPKHHINDDIPKNGFDQTIINLATQVTRGNHLPLQNQQYDPLNPPVLAPLNYQQQAHDVQQRMLQHQQAQQQQAQQQAQAAAQAAAQAQQAIIKQKIDDRDIPIDELLLKQDGHNHDHDSKLLTQEALDAIAQTERQVEILANKTTESEENNNLFAALKSAAESEQAGHLDNYRQDDYDDELNICIYCGSTRDVQDSGSFQICSNCFGNLPDANSVFNDLSSYLARVSLGKVTDSKNIILIKNFDQGEFISDFKQYEDGTNNLEEVINELSQRFIDPLIESSGFKFIKFSNNFSSRSPLKAIKLLYKCKQDINSHTKEEDDSNSDILKTEDCDSALYVSYDIFSKDIGIRYNHRSHRSYLEKKYSQALIDKVKDLYQTSNNLGEVYDSLLNVDDDGVKDETRDLKKETFVRDFDTF